MSALTLTFSQAWTETPQDINPGTVTIQRKGDTLELEADLTDANIHAPEAAFNEEAYTKSDVFELFIRAEGDEHYHELHISPINALLLLRFPGPATGKLNVEQAKVHHPLFTSSTERTAHGWLVKMSMPLANITEQSPIPSRWQISCGRYDYRQQEDGTWKAVIANTAPLTVPNFHRIAEWPTYDLGTGA